LEHKALTKFAFYYEERKRFYATKLFHLAKASSLVPFLAIQFYELVKEQKSRLEHRKRKLKQDFYRLVSFNKAIIFYNLVDFHALAFQSKKNSIEQ
jgi:hypothetical protein